MPWELGNAKFQVGCGVCEVGSKGMMLTFKDGGARGNEEERGEGREG